MAEPSKERDSAKWGRLLTDTIGSIRRTYTTYLGQGRKKMVRTEIIEADIDLDFVEYLESDAKAALKAGRLKEFFETEIAIARIKG